MTHFLFFAKRLKVEISIRILVRIYSPAITAVRLKRGFRDYIDLSKNRDLGDGVRLEFARRSLLLLP